MKKILLAISCLLACAGALLPQEQPAQEQPERQAETDPTEAVKRLREAAEQGDAEAQYRFGLSLANEKGVKKNEAEAVKWWRKAAEQGFAEAQYQLGESLAKGKGTKKNRTEAVKWFRKAAEQGFAEAQYSLGWSYSVGEGVKKDEAEAAKWLRKFAEARAKLAESESSEETAERQEGTLQNPSTPTTPSIPSVAGSSGSIQELPAGFSYLRDIDPSILVDLRYASANNFTGSVVDGYFSDQAAILTTGTAKMLSDVQEHLKKENLGLLVYDAYRPEKATKFFVAWAGNEDASTKAAYYPNIDKAKLFTSGYIASESEHSSGYAVDVTLVDLSSGTALDMGGAFDLFDEISRHGNPSITVEQRRNRAKLKAAMEKFGFTAYSKEWWHYSYRQEPPSEYFDFDVR